MSGLNGMKTLRTVFAVCLLSLASAACASPQSTASAGDKWLVEIPRIPKTMEDKWAKIEPLPGGGVKQTIRSNLTSPFYWTVKNLSARGAKHWKIRGTIERLDRGGSGIMFGRRLDPKIGVNTSIYMAVYLSGGNLKLIERTGNIHGASTKLLREVPVGPELQKPGIVVMTVEIDRETDTVKCSVDGTEYINENVAKHGMKLPMVEHYGFFGSSVESKAPSAAIFRKIETMRSN